MRWLSVLGKLRLNGALLEDLEELPGGHNPHALVRTHGSQSRVSGDQVFGSTRDRGGENEVVLGVAGDTLYVGSDWDNRPSLAQHGERLRHLFGSATLAKVRFAEAPEHFIEHVLGQEKVEGPVEPQVEYLGWCGSSPFEADEP